jgi:hypothetical protein
MKMPKVDHLINPDWWDCAAIKLELKCYSHPPTTLERYYQSRDWSKMNLWYESPREANRVKRLRGNVHGDPAWQNERGNRQVSMIALISKMN